MKSLCLLLLGVALVAAKPHVEPLRDYNGAQVLRVHVNNLATLRYMSWLQANTMLDFWTGPRLGANDILARRWDLPQLKQTLNRLDLDFDVQIPNVAQYLAKIQKRTEEARSKSTKMDWESYQTYDEIMAWLDEVAATYPDIATVTDVGLSYEGRTMKLLKLSTGSGGDAIWADGGIHAREWIAPAVVTYIIDQILTTDVGFLDGVDFYFMPSINPDGYSYTWSDDRFWRKTRSPNDGSACFGTDPNRNWDYHWGGSGTSDLPCSDIYCGAEPFSEIETQNVRDQLAAIVPRIYLSYHSYSQMILYPWGYALEYPDNVDDLDSLGNAAADALTAVYGTSYQVGSSTSLLGAGAGGSDDYALGVIGSEYSYTIELRDRGFYGFDLPEDQILPTAIETYEAFKVMVQFVIDNPSKK